MESQESISQLASQKRKKQVWTQQEDALLLKLIKRFGPRRWASIASKIPNWEGKQCRERWHNHLDPGISKTSWSEFEEWMLFLLY